MFMPCIVPGCAASLIVNLGLYMVCAVLVMQIGGGAAALCLFARMRADGCLSDPACAGCCITHYRKALSVGLTTKGDRQGGLVPCAEGRCKSTAEQPDL
jgi:hypothetical protein